MYINRTLPTGFNTLDIIFGENERDLKGRLTNIHRGIPIGEQGFIAAIQGAGKSTLTAQITSTPIRMGYPCDRVIVFDADGNVWNKKKRMMKLTGFSSEEEFDKYYHVYQTNIVEEIISILETEHKDYMKKMKDMGNKFVTYFDPIRQEEAKMKPYVQIVIDTVTSINSDMYDVDGKKEIQANESSLTTYRYLANLANTICNFFDKNVSVIWLAHLKDNTPKLGATIAEKDFKSMSNSKKAAVPLRIKQKSSWGMAMTAINDSSNLDSSKHPINAYGMVDVENGQAYSVEYVFVKNRTGTEGRTKGELMFVNGMFDPDASLIVDAKNFKLFDEKGMYPSAEYPTVFKDSDDEEAAKVCSRYKKTGLTIEGYSRPTNIIEARRILKYTGEDPELQTYQGELYSALVNKLEDTLKYELDSNCVTEESILKNKTAFDRRLGFYSKLRRPQEVLTEVVKKPEKVVDVDFMMSDDKDDDKVA